MTDRLRCAGREYTDRRRLAIGRDADSARDQERWVERSRSAAGRYPGACRAVAAQWRAYSATRSSTASSAAVTVPQSTGGLRVVLDHELGGLGGGAVHQQLDEAERHVDAARDARSGDDPVVEVLDHPLGRRAPHPSASSSAMQDQWVVAVSPSSRPAAARTSEPVQTEVVNRVVRWASRTQSSTTLVVSSAGRVPDPAGEHDDVGRRAGRRMWHRR